jgi:transposase
MDNHDAIEQAIEQPKVESSEVPAKPQRRKFTSGYKLKILREADECKNGELGALLRREGLYSSMLAQWRKDRAAGVLISRSERKRGRKPNPETREYAILQKKYARLQKQMEQANAIIETQKKLCQLYGLTLLPETTEWDPSEPPES